MSYANNGTKVYLVAKCLSDLAFHGTKKQIERNLRWIYLRQ
jgi:hypothetical protein